MSHGPRHAICEVRVGTFRQGLALRWYAYCVCGHTKWYHIGSSLEEVLEAYHEAEH